MGRGTGDLQAEAGLGEQGKGSAGRTRDRIGPGTAQGQLPGSSQDCPGGLALHVRAGLGKQVSKM